MSVCFEFPDLPTFSGVVGCSLVSLRLLFEFTEANRNNLASVCQTFTGVGTVDHSTILQSQTKTYVWKQLKHSENLESILVKGRVSCSSIYEIEWNPTIMFHCTVRFESRVHYYRRSHCHHLVLFVEFLCTFTKHSLLFSTTMYG